MDKDRILQVADRMAQERYQCDFYELHHVLLKVGIYSMAEQEVIEQDAEQADAERERRKYHGNI